MVELAAASATDTAARRLGTRSFAVPSRRLTHLSNLQYEHGPTSGKGRFRRPRHPEGLPFTNFPDRSVCRSPESRIDRQAGRTTARATKQIRVKHVNPCEE